MAQLLTFLLERPFRVCRDPEEFGDLSSLETYSLQTVRSTALALIHPITTMTSNLRETRHQLVSWWSAEFRPNVGRKLGLWQTPTSAANRDWKLETAHG